MATTVSAAGNHAGSAAGERQVRPLRSMHNVKPGETLASISQQYGIPVTELIRANSHAVGSGGVVHAGMRLELA